MIGQLVRRILLVEDDPLIRKVMSRCLAAEGYEVQTAIDGLDALTKLHAKLPDLIITDLNMPRMSGFELLEVLRKRFPQLPCVAMTSCTPTEISGIVAADAYYHKNGTGFQQLPETIANLARKLPQRGGHPIDDKEPVLAT